MIDELLLSSFIVLGLVSGNLLCFTCFDHSLALYYITAIVI